MQGSVATTESPAGSAAARPRRPGFAWFSGRASPRPVAVVSDEQFVTLIAAADGLKRRHRQRCADHGLSAKPEDRVLRLDRAGRLVLADRAAQCSA